MRKFKVYVKISFQKISFPEKIISLVNLKQQNPRLKVLAAVGGANDELSKAFSKLSSSEQTRKNFVNNVSSFIRRYSLDGIDIDYEFPITQQDKLNFVLLLQSLKKALKASNYILSVAVAADKWRANAIYDIPKIAQSVDLINLMSYDYHGTWNEDVGHHAQMYPHRDDTFYRRELNCAASASYWVAKGAPPEKLNFGIPTYGNSFVLSSPKEHKIGSPVNVTETRKSRGPKGYNEFCAIKQNGWTQHFDTNYRVYYAVKGLLWFGFDSIQQVSMKAKFVRYNKLGGVVFWSLDNDDYSSFCGQGKFPLIKAVLEEFEV